MRKNIQRLGWTVVVACMFISAGCTSAKNEKMGDAAAGPIPGGEREKLAEQSAARLQSVLDQFEEYFQGKIESVTGTGDTPDATRQQRRVLLIWKMRMIETCRTAIAQPEPLKAMVDAWALCEQIKRYVESEEGKRVFGERHEQAVSTAEAVNNRIRGIARDTIPESEYEHLRESIEKFAMARPLPAEADSQVPRAFSTASEGVSMLKNLVSIPLAPLFTFNKFNSSADSFRELTHQARRFTGIVEDLPSSIRWQLQLLTLHLEETETIQSLTKSISDVSASTVRLTDVAEQLPEKVREQTRAALADLEQTQPELRATLKDLRETTADMRGTLDDAQQIAGTVEQTVAGFTEAAEAWKTTADAVAVVMQEITALRPAPQTPPAAAESGSKSSGEEHKSFDIAEYTVAAEALADSARQVQKVLADIRNLIESDVPQERIELLEARAVGQINGVVDHLTWRLVQLCGMVFVLGLVYRFVPARSRVQV